MPKGQAPYPSSKAMAKGQKDPFKKPDKSQFVNGKLERTKRSETRSRVVTPKKGKK